MTKTSIEWTDEVWRTIQGAPGYSVSSHGSISGPRGKLHPMKSDSGHLYVFIHRKRQYIHRLVLSVFFGPCPIGMECRHLDGNPENNNIQNLTWGTRQENADDRRRHGREPIPHESSFTKLKPEDIRVIRDMHTSGLSSRKIGARFCTSHTTIQKIIRAERWKGY